MEIIDDAIVPDRIESVRTLLAVAAKKLAFVSHFQVEVVDELREAADMSRCISPHQGHPDLFGG